MAKAAGFGPARERIEVTYAVAPFVSAAEKAYVASLTDKQWSELMVTADEGARIQGARFGDVLRALVSVLANGIRTEVPDA